METLNLEVLQHELDSSIRAIYRSKRSYSFIVESVHDTVYKVYPESKECNCTGPEGLEYNGLVDKDVFWVRRKSNPYTLRYFQCYRVNTCGIKRIIEKRLRTNIRELVDIAISFKII